MLKRLIDILVAFTTLIILLPILLPIMTILRMTGEGYIFYTQLRVGKDGRLFNLIKFSTMLKDSPNIGPGLMTTANDPRIFPFGRVLRKTKINEIPQLLNVLLGDMSIIGPRPTVRTHFDYFPKHVQNIISKIKPGLTGIGSIVFRNEEDLINKYGGNNPKKYFAEKIEPYKGELEVWYVNNQSLWVDLKIFVATIFVVLLPKSRFYLKWFKDLPKSKFFESL